MGPCSVSGTEKLNDFGCDIHASGGVDAGCDAEGYVEASKSFCSRIELGGRKERSQSNADGAAKFAKPERGNDAVLANKRHSVSDGCDGSHFEEAGKYFFSRTHRVVAFKDGLRQFECDGGTAERLFGIAAGGLVGIEDGERVGRLFRRPMEGDGR